MKLKEKRKILEEHIKLFLAYLALLVMGIVFFLVPVIINSR